MDAEKPNTSLEEITPATQQNRPQNQEDGDHVRSMALSAETSDLPPGYFYSSRFIGTFVGIAFTLVATYFLFEASASVITFINADIGPSDNSALFSIVWTVAQPISILLFGRLSDRFGRRNFALGGNLLGIVGAIVACTAKKMNTLIGAMVILGLASGPIASYPLLTGELASNKAKFIATVMVVVPNIIATGFAPYIGQRLVAVANWRWIYYIYIIIIAPGTISWYLFYRPPSYVQLHGKQVSKLDELKKTDWLGIFLLVAGLTLFLLGVSWGGTTAATAWSSARILGLLISGFVCCVAFILYECFANIRQPVIPMRFFKDVRGFACVNIISAITGCINVALFILWPSQVIHVFGSTNSGWQQTAWMSCTINFGLWTGIILVGPLYHIIRHIRWQLIVGSAWMAIFLGIMSTLKRSHRSTAIAISFLSCLPIGWGEIITMLMAQYVVDDQDLGVGFAVTSANRTILGSIFTAVFIAILTNKLPGQLQKHLIPEALAAGLPESSLPQLLTAVTGGSQAALTAVPGMNSTILAVVNDGAADSYAGAYAYVYYAALALGLVCFIAAACLRDFDQYLTNHVSRQVYHKKETQKDILDLIEEKTPASA